MGESRLATVPRPDVCARLDRLAAEVTELQVGDIFCPNDLIRLARARKKAAVVKENADFDINDFCVAWWPAPAFGSQAAEGKCLLGHRVAIIPTPSRGSRHLIRATSCFTRSAIKSSLGAWGIFTFLVNRLATWHFVSIFIDSFTIGSRRWRVARIAIAYFLV